MLTLEYFQGTYGLSDKGQKVIEPIVNVFGKENIKIFVGKTKKVFVLIRGQLELIKNMAEVKNYYLPADEKNLEDKAKEGWPTNSIPPVTIENGKSNKITRFSPFQHIHLKYEVKPEFQPLYKERPGAAHPFTDDFKLDIMRRILTEPPEAGGLDIQFRKLIDEGTVLAFFPLHNEAVLAALKKEWFSGAKHVLPWNSPYSDIKTYFGAKIALYFQFLGL